MDFDDALEYRPASPEFVHSIFQSALRDCAAQGEADDSVELRMDTTIDEWLDAHLEDFFSWRRFARGMNDAFKMNVPMHVWKAAIEPYKQKTLGGVCELIVANGVRLAMRPVTVLGNPCLPAGAFFAVKKLLQDNGADVSELTPSTAIGEFARLHPRVFFDSIAQLVPGSLPTPRIQHRACTMANWCILLSVGMVAAGGFLGPWLIIIGAPSVLLSYLASHMAAKFVPPSCVEYPGLNSFADLARALASAGNTA